MSLNKDNSHSWVRISHGSNKFVINLNNNEQEIAEVQLEEDALKLYAKDFASRSKAKAKPQRREPAHSPIMMYRRHSVRSLIAPILQDNVVIPSNFFQYVYHVGCAINLHSIINSGLIPGGQHLSNRQTVFFLLVDPLNKEHKES